MAIVECRGQIKRVYDSDGMFSHLTVGSSTRIGPIAITMEIRCDLHYDGESRCELMFVNGCGRPLCFNLEIMFTVRGSDGQMHSFDNIEETGLLLAPLGRMYFSIDSLSDLRYYSIEDWCASDVSFIVDVSHLSIDWEERENGASLPQMWADMLFPDMHLITTGGDELSCHRAVLCSASPVFKAMLTGNFKEASHAEVTVHDATSTDIRAFLEFVYTWDLPDGLDQASLVRILRMADMYEIGYLAEVCALRLVLQTDKSNIAEAVSALFPYQQSEGPLGKWSAYLVDLLQSDKEMLVSYLSRVKHTPTLNHDLEDPTLASMLMQPMASITEYASPDLQDTSEAAAVDPETDPETDALPLLMPESHQHVEIEVIRFPLPPPGLDLQSHVPDVSSSNALEKLNISVLCFNHCTKDFTNVLRGSKLAQAMLSRNAEVEPGWANGAKVFVQELRPEMLEPIMKVDSLRPWHVIVRSENEGDVIESINVAWHTGQFGSKRPRVRQACTQHLTLQQSSKQGCGINSSCPDGPLPVSRDAAGTVHYHVPPSLSPRSIVTAPP